MTQLNLEYFDYLKISYRMSFYIVSLAHPPILFILKKCTHLYVIKNIDYMKCIIYNLGIFPGSCEQNDNNYRYI